MGGHERGAEASRTALDIIQSFLQPDVLVDKLRDITEVEGIPSKIVCLHALVADAIEKGADVIITQGAVQSNHARQKAAAASTRLSAPSRKARPGWPAQFRCWCLAMTG